MPPCDGKPLSGRTVVVTRATQQAAELAEGFRSAGAEVLVFPVLRYARPASYEALDAALGSVHTFDWIFFTSQNAVRFFAARARELGLEAPERAGRRPRMAAVGAATAETLEREGWRVDYVAQRAQGRALAEELAPQLNGRRVLLPRSDRARDELPDALRRAGVKVVAVEAYSTASSGAMDQDLLVRIRQRGADVVTLASPSAFHSFAATIGEQGMERLRGQAAFAAIGPTTAGAIREAGFTVSVEAQEFSAAGLVDSVIRHFANSNTSGVLKR